MFCKNVLALRECRQCANFARVCSCTRGVQPVMAVLATPNVFRCLCFFLCFVRVDCLHWCLVFFSITPSPSRRCPVTRSSPSPSVMNSRWCWRTTARCVRIRSRSFSVIALAYCSEVNFCCLLEFLRVQVWTWGNNSNGQLGYTPDSGSWGKVPKEVAGALLPFAFAPIRCSHL